MKIYAKTYAQIVHEVLELNKNKLVTHKQLMNASGIPTRQQLYMVIEKLRKGRLLRIKKVHGDGYKYIT